MVQKLEIRVVHPAGVFRPVFGNAHAVHHHQQLLAAGLGLDVVKVPAARQGVLVLGHLHDDVDAADRLLGKAALQNFRPGEPLPDGVVGQAQLPQRGNDRHHVVNVEQAVGDQRIGVLRAVLFPHGHGAGGKIHMLRQIVRLRGVEAAAFAHGVADVVVPPVIIPQLSGAAGTDAHIVQQVHAVGHVAVHGPDAEIAPVVFLRHAAGDEVVGVEDQLALPGEIAAENVRDIAGMGVAHDGIPEQVGDQNIVGPHIGVDLGRGALVDLQHRHVAPLHPAQQVAVADKGGGYAGGDVAAGPVGQDMMALRLQNVHQHVADGGLAVGAGDGHHHGGLAHIF